MKYQHNDSVMLAMAPERGGADYDDLGSGSTAGYGATDADEVGRGDDMDDDELLDEEDDDIVDDDELAEDLDDDVA